VKDSTRPPGALLMWTIYDHPSDQPNVFLARLYEIDINGTRPTAECMASESLEALRVVMQKMGLTCLGRAEGDDPVIVETWV